MQHNTEVEHHIVENIDVDLADIVMNMNRQASNTKAKDKVRKKLEARRGIELHFEKKHLKDAIKEFWEDI